MSVRTTGIELIGMISTTLASEIYGKSIITGAVDPRFIAEFARVHEDGGFDGEFYRVRGAVSEVKPLQRPAIPIYFGGASGPALAVGARHCDVYALWGEPVAAIRQSIAEVRAAAPPGRTPRFSVSVRPIL